MLDVAPYLYKIQPMRPGMLMDFRLASTKAVMSKS
jgi:hypothetical protein